MDLNLPLMGGALLLLGMGCGSSKSAPDVPVTPGIQGTAMDTCHALAAVAQVPEDYSTVSIVALVPNGSGGFTSVQGQGTSNGTFKVPTGPSGFYWLKVGNLYFWTDQTSFDLGYDFQRRADAVASVGGTSDEFNVTGLQSWTDNDNLTFYDYNTNNVYPSLGDASSLVAGATSLAGLTMQWQPGSYVHDATKGDQSYLLHLVGQPFTGGTFQTLQQVFVPGAYTEGAVGPTVLSGSFTAVPATASVRMKVNASEFIPQASAGGPNPILSVQEFSVGALKDGISAGEFGAPARFVDLVTTNAAGTDFDLGDVAYGNPFPSSWDVLQTASAAFVSTITFPGSLGNFLVWSRISCLSQTLPTAASPISPLVTWVTEPTINGQSLMTTQTAVGTTPTIAWKAPATSSNPSYQVTLIAYAPGDSNVMGVTNLFTDQTSFQVPPGLMGSGYYYVLRITASQSARTRATSPWRVSAPCGSADFVSAWVTP